MMSISAMFSLGLSATAGSQVSAKLNRGSGRG